MSIHSGDSFSQSTATVQVTRADAFGSSRQEDRLAVEEPLEISIAHGSAAARQRARIAVTMRTPGHDFDLAMGFLFTEGIVGYAADVVAMRYAANKGEAAYANELIVELKSDIGLDTDRLSRHFYTASSCGVCGKASLELVQTTACYTLRNGHPGLSVATLLQMPEKLNAEQSVFATTGGLHAAALFDAQGNLLDAKEDVGRHNALDKLIGAALKKEALPLSDHIVMVSGRASFELVQKALMAGIPVLAAVGAPSSLAVELAAESGMTLIGFLRDGRCNVYTGMERVS